MKPDLIGILGISMRCAVITIAAVSTRFRKLCRYPSESSNQKVSYLLPKGENQIILPSKLRRGCEPQHTLVTAVENMQN